ncbi:MAG: helix-turn-helix domain-containing protein [Dehalococcoidia bacterium]|nr:helix-turn-helix domain-containing protein [Dehalococcoidia bacterium]
MAYVNREDTMLTASELARLLNLHINTVRRWSNRGILKAYRVGPRGDRRFRKGDVDNFLAENLEANYKRKEKELSLPRT